MSEDLIKRSDAIKALRKLGHEVVVIDKVCSLGVATEFIDAIRDIPSADRPQGEWIEVRAFDAFGGDEAAWMAHGNPIAFHYCSECKEQSRLDEFGEEMLSNYCPNCGCRMKGADDEVD